MLQRGTIQTVPRVGKQRAERAPETEGFWGSPAISGTEAMAEAIDERPRNILKKNSLIRGVFRIG